MSAYWIAIYHDMKNPENIKKYAEKASPAIKKYNGVILARGGKVETIEGNPSPRTVLIKFPSHQYDLMVYFVINNFHRCFPSEIHQHPGLSTI